MVNFTVPKVPENRVYSRTNTSTRGVERFLIEKSLKMPCDWLHKALAEISTNSATHNDFFCSVQINS